MPTHVRPVDGPARVLLVITPGGLDEFFAERDALLAARADRSTMLRLAEGYGLH